MAKTAILCAALLVIVAGVQAEQKVLSARAQVLPAAAAVPLIYETTPRYNSLPWHFTIEKLYAFAISPLRKAPTPCPAYAAANTPAWPFQGGNGWLVAIKFADSPIAAYSEVFYIPGTFKPTCSRQAYNSVQRIWVDSEASQHAGRSIWGIPKEMATFKWTDAADGSWMHLTITDRASGTTFFRANMSDIELGAGVNVPGWLLPSNIRSVMQWPIDEADKTFLPSKDAFMGSRIANFTTQFTQMRPVLTHLDFSGRDSRVAQANEIWMDPATFTGDASAAVFAIPLAVHMQEGTQASLAAPVFIDGCDGLEA